MRAVRLSDVLKSPPEARAEFNASPDAPHLKGDVRFHRWNRGVLIRSEFINLPRNARYQLKIKEKETGQEERSIRHLPRFFPDNGYSLFLFYSDQVLPEELCGKHLLLLCTDRAEAAPEAVGRAVIESKNYQS